MNYFLASSSGGDAGTGFVLLAVIFGAYFLPLFIAKSRNHHNIGAIAVVNIFLGWTFIGWIVALAMASGQVKGAPPPKRMIEIGTGRVHNAPGATPPSTTAPGIAWGAPASSAAGFCTACGKALTADARFCAKCGAEVPS